MAEARMFTDIRVRRGSAGHLKISKLSARLKADAYGSLVRLWAYASEVSPDDGNLGALSLEDLGVASEWNRFNPECDPDAFGRELLALRLVDRLDDGSLVVHDWRENQGFLASAPERIEAARANGKRSAEVRRERTGTAQPPRTPRSETPNDSRTPRSENQAKTERPVRSGSSAPERPPNSGPDRTGPDRSYSGGSVPAPPPARVIPPTTVPVHGRPTPTPTPGGPATAPGAARSETAGEAKGAPTQGHPATPGGTAVAPSPEPPRPPGEAKKLEDMTREERDAQLVKIRALKAELKARP